MSNTIYSTLSRQTGLMNELRVIANNIANAATTGFRNEAVIFSEHVKSLDVGNESLSLANARAHKTDFSQGVLTRTGGQFDLGIEGDGFFQIQTPAGVRLTRAGSFIPSPAGELLTPDGYQLLDAGGAPVFVPIDAQSISVAADGTVSADGNPLGQVGLVVPEDITTLVRENGVRFRTDSPLIPAEEGSVVQGFLEGSNVQPVTELSRLIEVQRAYEMGQSFMESEDERLKSIFALVGR